MSLINKEDLMLTLGITDMDCEKCGWYSKAARRCKRGSDFEDACCAIEDAPEVLPEPKWIPVSERLPLDHERYLLTQEIHYTTGRIIKRVCMAFYDDENDEWLEEQGEDCEIVSYPLAWMPLPEPYREGET